MTGNKFSLGNKPPGEGLSVGRISPGSGFYLGGFFQGTRSEKVFSEGNLYAMELSAYQWSIVGCSLNGKHFNT